VNSFSKNGCAKTLGVVASNGCHLAFSLTPSVVRVVEIGTWKIVSELAIKGVIRAIAISPDSNGIAVSVFDAFETSSTDPFKDPVGDLFLFEKSVATTSSSCCTTSGAKWREYHIPPPCKNGACAVDIPCGVVIDETCGSILDPTSAASRDTSGYSFGSSVSISNDFRIILVGVVPFAGNDCNLLSATNVGTYLMTTKKITLTGNVPSRSYNTYPLRVGSVAATVGPDDFRMTLSALSKTPDPFTGNYTGAYVDGVGRLYVWSDLNPDEIDAAASSGCYVINPTLTEHQYYEQTDCATLAGSSAQYLVPSALSVSGNGRFVAYGTRVGPENARNVIDYDAEPVIETDGCVKIFDVKNFGTPVTDIRVPRGAFIGSAELDYSGNTLLVSLPLQGKVVVHERATGNVIYSTGGFSNRPMSLWWWYLQAVFTSDDGTSFAIGAPPTRDSEGMIEGTNPVCTNVARSDRVGIFHYRSTGKLILTSLEKESCPAQGPQGPPGIAGPPGPISSTATPVAVSTNAPSASGATTSAVAIRNPPPVVTVIPPVTTTSAVTTSTTGGGLSTSSIVFIIIGVVLIVIVVLATVGLIAYFFMSRNKKKKISSRKLSSSPER